MNILWKNFLLISVNLLKCRSKRDVDRPRLHIMMTYVGCWMEIISIVRVGIFNVQLKKKKKRLNYFFSKKNFLNFFYQTFPHLSLKYTDTFRWAENAKFLMQIRYAYISYHFWLRFILFLMIIWITFTLSQKSYSTTVQIYSTNKRYAQVQLDKSSALTKGKGRAWNNGHTSDIVRPNCWNVRRK